MKTSPEGIKQIARREGSVLHVYKDSKGLPTAGVGHLLSSGENQLYPVGSKVTQAQSDEWLAADLREAEDAVNSIGADLAQNEFDALVSLTFNIGVGGFEHSTVAKRLKQGDKASAAKAILLWDQPPEIQGRRRTEYNQFLTPYKQVSAAVASDNPTTDGVISDATSDPLQSDTSGTPPPITTTVEQTQSQAVSTATGTTASETKVTSEIPKGDTPDAPPTKVTQNDLASKILTGVGGVGTLVTAAWGFLTSNPNTVSVGLICATILILVIMDRWKKTDVVRMQTAADPDKNNVS